MGEEIGTSTQSSDLWYLGSEADCPSGLRQRHQLTSIRKYKDVASNPEPALEVLLSMYKLPGQTLAARQIAIHLNPTSTIHVCSQLGTSSRDSPNFVSLIFCLTLSNTAG
jgi:hypothetical protein